MTTLKMTAGEAFPDLSWPRIDGGAVEPALGTGWRVLIVYRGQHCPLCKGYLKTLNDLLDDFKAADIAVSVLSADSLDQAKGDAEKYRWTFPVAYGLTVDQMRQLGLYISTPLSPQETDHDFPEPGLFVISPQGQTQIIDVSNAPFARPDLKSLLGGLQYVIAKSYPIRGQA